MPGIRCRQTEGRKGIRHNVRSGRQILPGSGGKVHNALNTREHIRGLPPCHRHVVHGLRRLRSRELRFGAHLTGLIPQCLQIGSRGTRNRRHLAHGGIKIRRRLHRRRPKPRDSPRNWQELLSHRRNIVPQRLQLLPRGRYSLHRRSRLVRLLLQVPQGILRLDDLPLQRIVLLLGNLPIGEGSIRLLRRRLQSFQFLLDLRDCLPQKPVPLSQQLRIARVKFQQFLHIPQLGLGIAYFRIDPFQGGLQLGSIAANLHRNALDPVRHQDHLPSKTT